MFTWTLNSNIIIMTTVTSDTNLMKTVQQIGLISTAGNIIKPYGTSSLPMEGIQSCN